MINRFQLHVSAGRRRREENSEAESEVQGVSKLPPLHWILITAVIIRHFSWGLWCSILRCWTNFMAWFLSRCGKQNGLTGASKILVYLEKARKERFRENDPNIFSFFFFYLRFFQRLSFFRWSFFSPVLICASVLPVMDFLRPSLPKSRHGTTVRKVSEMCSACRKGALHVWGTLKHKFNVVGGTRRHPIYVANLARLATYGKLILFLILDSFSWIGYIRKRSPIQT